MMAAKDAPFILQKAGGLQGTFSYVAFAPTRGVAVFVAINKFDFAAAFQMGKFANELLANLSRQWGAAAQRAMVTLPISAEPKSLPEVCEYSLRQGTCLSSAETAHSTASTSPCRSF
jgi:soluble lytic murein transglycosylase-like protein